VKQTMTYAGVICARRASRPWHRAKAGMMAGGGPRMFGNDQAASNHFCGVTRAGHRISLENGTVRSVSAESTRGVRNAGVFHFAPPRPGHLT